MHIHIAGHFMSTLSTNSFTFFTTYEICKFQRSNRSSSISSFASPFDLPILAENTEPTSLDDNNHHDPESGWGKRRKMDNYTLPKLEFPSFEFGLFVGPRWLLLPGRELSAPAWARDGQDQLFGRSRFGYCITI